MPTGPFLETKFFAPRWRPSLVPRPRLLERLERGVQSKLTLISAPAGFGKTTLLAEWISEAPDARPIAWLSLDQRDAPPSNFWLYLIAALQRVEPEVGAAALALLESPAPPLVESVLTGVLNEVGAATAEIVLVLDDYHLVESREIHEGMTFLLEHLPPNLHLVITGRADPPLPLARLRGRGEMSELRAADLRFTAEEGATFLNEAMGLALSAADIALLDARTEGWIAGLQLAALSMQGRNDVAGFVAAFSGDDRYIVDYLVEEVLDRQPAHLRQFLLQTSILERLNGPLCDAVTGTAGARATLEGLERGNLFVVPLDDRREWYRYQHLFADVLQAHLREEQPDEIPELHRRASRWFEAHDVAASAIDHARAAGDSEGVARLLAASYEEFARRGNYGSLMGWLAALPEEMLRQRPRLALIYARSAIASQNTNEMPRRLTGWAEAALRGIQDRGGLDPADDIGGTFVGPDGVDILRGELLALTLMHSARSLPAEQVAEMAREARALLPAGSREHLRGTLHVISAGTREAVGDFAAAEASFDRIVAEARESKNPTLLVGTLNHRGQMSVTQGRLEEAQRIFDEALQAGRDVSTEMNWLVCSPHTSLGEIYLERNDLARAREHVVAAIDVASASPGRSYVLYAWAAAAQVFQAAGEYEAGLAQLRRAEAFVHGSKRDRFASFLASVQLDFHLRSGNLETAGAIVRARHLAAGDVPRPDNELELLAFARYLLAVEDPASAQPLLAKLVSLARDAGRMQQEIRALVPQALACEGLGDRATALESLGRATRLAERGGYVRTFTAEAGSAPLLHALVATAARGSGTIEAGSPTYLRALLDGTDSSHGGVTPQTGAPSANSVASPLAEPLTTRELEILQLVASGMRNQEIADHLVISLPTVKRHIANVYGKLGVSHRTEAVALANDLALL